MLYTTVMGSSNQLPFIVSKLNTNCVCVCVSEWVSECVCVCLQNRIKSIKLIFHMFVYIYHLWICLFMDKHPNKAFYYVNIRQSHRHFLNTGSALGPTLLGLLLVVGENIYGLQTGVTRTTSLSLDNIGSWFCRW